MKKGSKKILKIRFNPKKSSNKKEKKLLKEQKHLKQTNEESINCPYCHNIIILNDKLTEDATINCPNCGYTFQMLTLKEKPPSKDVEIRIKYDKILLYKQNFRAKIFSLILILIGLILLINPNPFDIKLSITLIIVGITILAIITDKKFVIIFPKEENNLQRLSLLKKPEFNAKIKKFIEKPLDIYDKIAIITVVIVLFLFIITGDADIEIFLILIYVGFLILKEFTKEFTPISLKKRMNILFFAFLAIFILVITKRIISLLNI